MVKRIAIAVLAVCTVLAAIYQIGNAWIAREEAVAAAPLSLLPPAEERRVSDAWNTIFGTRTEHAFVARAFLASNPGADAAVLARADMLVARVPAGHERSALDAQLAQRRGDAAGALAAALDAHDMATVDKQLDRLAIRGDTATALRWQRRVIVALTGDPTQREALADAYWRLGALENALSRKGERRLHVARALAAFRAELALTPLSGRALLSAGYAALGVDDVEEARRFFRAALANDPASASALVGLGQVALRDGHPDAARGFALRAQSLAPAQSDVRELEAALAAWPRRRHS